MIIPRHHLMIAWLEEVVSVFWIVNVLVVAGHC